MRRVLTWNNIIPSFFFFGVYIFRSFSFQDLSFFPENAVFSQIVFFSKDCLFFAKIVFYLETVFFSGDCLLSWIVFFPEMAFFPEIVLFWIWSFYGDCLFFVDCLLTEMALFPEIIFFPKVFFPGICDCGINLFNCFRMLMFNMSIQFLSKHDN